MITNTAKELPVLLTSSRKEHRFPTAWPTHVCNGITRHGNHLITITLLVTGNKFIGPFQAVVFNR